MKSFTKPELIQDVTSDILKHWTPDKTMRNYFPGVIAGMKKNGHSIGGFDAYTTSNVLKGSGISSSAAF